MRNHVTTEMWNYTGEFLLDKGRGFAYVAVILMLSSPRACILRSCLGRVKCPPESGTLAGKSWQEMLGIRSSESERYVGYAGHTLMFVKGERL